MADLPEGAPQPETWLIHKVGRGWYRPNAQGYTNNPAEAGRFTHVEALSYSYPNGLEGPRDGLTIKHERDVPGALPAPDLAAELAEALRDIADNTDDAGARDCALAALAKWEARR